MLSIAHRPLPSHLLSACHRRRTTDDKMRAALSPPVFCRHTIEYVGCARAMAARAMAAWAMAARNLACMAPHDDSTVQYRIVVKYSSFFLVRLLQKSPAKIL